MLFCASFGGTGLSRGIVVCLLALGATAPSSEAFAETGRSDVCFYATSCSQTGAGVHTASIERSEAEANCALNIADNPGVDIACCFNGVKYYQNVATTGPACDLDGINSSMAALKWEYSGGASKSWLTLNGASSLRSWYNYRAQLGRPAPNLDDFLSQRMGRARVQNPAGTKPAFWIDSGSNVSLQAAQIHEVFRRAAGDVLAFRTSGSTSSKLSYDVYDTANSSTSTNFLIPTDYKSTYNTIKSGVSTDPAKARILLGYMFSNRAITADKSLVKKPSGTVEAILNRFTINPTNPTGNYLLPGEYLFAPGQALNVPLRNMAPVDPNAPAPQPGDPPVPIYADDHIYVDMANPAAVNKMIQISQDAYQGGFGLDGIAFDLTIYNPSYGPSLIESTNAYRDRDANWLCKYREGMRRKVGTNANSFFAIFNLLEHADLDLLNKRRQDAQNSSTYTYPPLTPAGWNSKQEELLQYAHGGVLEFFGGRQADNCNSEGNPPIEDKCDPNTFFFKRAFSSMLDHVVRWRRNPDKLFMVFARGPKNFVSYDYDYNWQAYLYGVYLLGSGPNTAFKYNSTFQFPLVNAKGRSDGLNLYDNQMLDLGQPLSQNKVTGGLHWRKFEKALVIVNPHDSNQVLSTAALQPHFPPGTDPASVKATLNPEESLIVMATPRNNSVGRMIDFRDSATRTFYAQNPGATAEANSLRIKENTVPRLTDILLSTVKYRNHRALLNLSLKTNGTRHNDQRKIWVKAEVDDNRTTDLGKRRRHVTFEFLPGPLPSGVPRTEVITTPLFRYDPTPSDESEDSLLIRIPNAFTIQDGVVQNIQLYPKNELDVAHGHYVFRRWDMIRFFGDFNVYYIQAGDQNWLTGILDF